MPLWQGGAVRHVSMKQPESGKEQIKKMKILKFDKAVNEAAFGRMADLAQESHPYVIVIPTPDNIEKLRQDISVRVLRDYSPADEAIDKIEDRIMAATAAYGCADDAGLCSHIKKRLAKVRLIAKGADISAPDREIRRELSLLTCDLMCAFLARRGLRAKTLDTSMLMQVNQEDRIDIPYARIAVRHHVNDNRDAEIFVAPSLLCRGLSETPCFIDRRRSDYYAVAIAAAFNADKVSIVGKPVTDMPSTSDCQSRTLTYEEAENIVDTGSYIIYMDSITLACRRSIELKFYDSSNPSNVVLTVGHHDDTPIKTIHIKNGLTFVRFTSLHQLPDFLFIGRVFKAIDRFKADIVAMSSSAASVAMMVSASRDAIRLIQKDLSDVAEMVADNGMALVRIIGSTSWERVHLETVIMDSIRDFPVSFISFGDTSQCFTLAVRTADSQKIVERLKAIKA